MKRDPIDMCREYGYFRVYATHNELSVQLEALVGLMVKMSEVEFTVDSVCRTISAA